MDFYSADHNGASLNSAELASLALSEDKLKGFFLFTQLDQLLHPAPALLKTNQEITGIRVYESKNNATSLIAVAVDTEGADIRSLYLASGMPRRGLDSISMPRSTDDVETDLGNNDTIKLAFFSSKMINTLRSDQSDGLSFYQVPLIVNDSQLTTDVLKANKADLESFIALPAVLDSSNNVVLPRDFDNPGAHVMSNLPCPGYCLNIGADRVIKNGLLVNIVPEDMQYHYPKPWNEERVIPPNV